MQGMPTPFTHLEIAQRLLSDPVLPGDVQAALAADTPAFLLGSVAADARNDGGLSREATHFYDYTTGISQHPWRVMLDRYPLLVLPRTAAQRAFIAGYVGHLCVDEIWSLDMLGPHFAGRDWAPRPYRFLMLHLLLIFMDERDLRDLESWQAQALAAAQPAAWTPFMTDETLRDWRDFISQQVSPGGASQTLEVFGGRIGKTPTDLRTMLDSPTLMQSDLWAHITPALLAQVEAAMYKHARTQLLVYWRESSG